MEAEYKKLELIAGLEIHQQLNTNKLFCNCPSLLRNDSPQYTIKRKLNPVIGETGIIDTAAAYEKTKDKTFEYQVFDTNCLVELDEEPPHKINKEALKIVLQISHLLNAKIFPVTQIMRKTVIDGSNTAGFQRTVLIAHDGHIETSTGKVEIEFIALEEDSARKSKSTGDKTIYSLDRLGIPLIEITTKPDLKTPEQIKETALKLGEILRACNVKRGIGTIRQDVNISIKGSKRVEIKGFQDTKIMIKTILTEIKRQQECLKNSSCKLEVRKSLPDGTTQFLRPMPTSARMYPETDLELLKISKRLIDETKKNLPKLATEHKSFLSEFGLNEELIKLILKNNRIEDFKTLSHTTSDKELIAKCLTLFQKELSIKENKTPEEISEILNVHTLEAVLEKVDKEIAKGDIKNVLQKLVQGKSFEESIKKSDINLNEVTKNLIKEKPDLSIQAYMGLIMGKYKGQVSGSEVSDVLKKLLHIT
ncbi:MAG: Glu-tRNA(Gln) amidotransferase subunit GatE [Nanoarchaeota archaeon]|nr:Glu-tRNA(Gln) amidotransferase subunit GatE [Nanoarchaeota archaeon]